VFVRRIGIFRLEWMNVYYFDKWSEGPKGWFVFGKPTKELTQAFDVAGSRPLLENPKPDELDFEKWLGTVSGHGESWARKTVEGLSAWVEQQLRLMAECQLPGFCTFALSEYPGYTSRNPKSGEKVPAKVRPKLTLTMSPELAQRLGAGTARENSKPPVT
jgi:nucleoid DNA-binding protein